MTLINLLSWNKVKRWFSVGKIITFALFAFLIAVTTVLVNIYDIWDKFFPDEHIIFKTVDIYPDAKRDTFTLCIFPGGEIVSVMNPLPSEDAPSEVWGPPWNITFALTNKTKQELLVDKIEATLIQYEGIPDKCIISQSGHNLLIPIDLMLILSPGKDEYDLSKGKYLTISSGTTEHVFRVYVAASEPGIYTFKIEVRCRIGGEKEYVVVSDTVYRFACPDWSKSAVCFFLYRTDQSDPNFKELIDIVNKPLDEFKQITSGWGEYKVVPRPGKSIQRITE